MASNKFITRSSEETKKIGEEFAKKLKKGDFIALFGELGGGKTTFIQGLSKGLGVQRRITSPTFLTLRTYSCAHLNIKNLYHVDLYKFDKVIGERLSALGINEVMSDEQGVTAVEWAEKMKDSLPIKRWEIKFTHIEDNNREITIRRIKDEG